MKMLSTHIKIVYSKLDKLGYALHIRRIQINVKINGLNWLTLFGVKGIEL